MSIAQLNLLQKYLQTKSGQLTFALSASYINLVRMNSDIGFHPIFYVAQKWMVSKRATCSGKLMP